LPQFVDKRLKNTPIEWTHQNTAFFIPEDVEPNLKVNLFKIFKITFLKKFLDKISASKPKYQFAAKMIFFIKPEIFKFNLYPKLKFFLIKLLSKFILKTLINFFEIRFKKYY